MKIAIPRSALGSEFDEFLFTPIGEDRNGLPLSVLSLFARLNLDPRQEAASLAALSLEAAAGRLLKLLPARQSTVQTPAVAAGAVAASDSTNRIRMILFITSALVLVGSQLLGAHRYPPAASVAPQVSGPPDH